MNHADLRPGRFVVVRADGRLGLLGNPPADGTSRVLVQFGAAGPIGYFLPKSLRYARRSEVDEAGLLGVGHSTTYAPELRTKPGVRLNRSKHQ